MYRPDKLNEVSCLCALLPHDLAKSSSPTPLVLREIDVHNDFNKYNS